MASKSGPHHQLDDLRAERTKLVARIGVNDIDTVEADFETYVRNCLAELQKGIVDARPVRENSNGSHNSNAVKVPSTNFGDIEEELKEFQLWFDENSGRKGSGRKPRLRNELSGYALEVMLGESVFGHSFLTRERWDIDRSDSNSGPVLRRRTFTADLLSEDETIHHRQFKAALAERGPNGEVIYRSVAKLESPWPKAFLDIVAAYRRPSKGEERQHLPIELLTTGLNAEDRRRMAEGFKLTIAIISQWRRTPDPRNKTTIPRWAKSEPIFKLTTKVLSRVWPVERGIGLPQLEMAGLMANLVLWVQLLVDGQVKNLPLHKTYGYPRSVLGGRPVVLPNRQNEGKGKELDDFGGADRVDKMDDPVIKRDDQLRERAGQVLQTITKLRWEDVAYFWAMETCRSIEDALYNHLYEVENLNLRAALQVATGTVFAELERQWNLRRNLLDFGNDNTQGETFKWFGRGDGRATGRAARDIASLVFPTNQDMDDDKRKLHFLNKLGKLVADLHLESAPMQSWQTVANWAAGPGLDGWRIEPEFPDNYLYEAASHILD